MSSQSTVTFKVAGNDVMSYMDKMKQKADQMTTDMIGNAKRQADAAKDQLKNLEDQIKALERKNRIESEAARRTVTTNLAEKNKDIEANYGGNPEVAAAKMSIASSNAKDQLLAIREQERQQTLQTKLMRDNIETIKQTSNNEVIQMRKGDDGIVDELDKDATPMERLSRELAEQKYNEEQDRQKKDKKDEQKPESTMGGFLRAMALERGLGLVSQMPSAKNELDFVKPMMSMIGMGIGGLMGNLMDAANIKILGTGLGQTSFGALGTQLGEKAGEFFGQAMERSYKSRDELTSANYRLQALTGKDLQINGFGAESGLGGTGISRVMANLSQYGLDFKEASEMQYKIAAAKGTSSGMARDSENMIAVERSLAVSQETSTALMEMRRNYSQDFMKLVGGIAQKGQGNIFANDRTFLNEFIGKNFISLQRELLKQGADNVSTGATFDILRRFNEVGGPFAARDYRSTGLISQINGALVNPNSDQTKAMSFLALRQANPGMGIADLMVEREKGLSSPTYMKSMMSYIDKMGGDDQFKRMNLAGMFGISNTAAQKLWENRGAMMNGTIAQGELAGTGVYGEEGIRATGRAQTSRYTKSTAEIQNAFVQDVAGGIKLVGSKMTELFGDMITELKNYIKGQFTGTTEQPNQVRKNKVMTDKEKKAAQQAAYNDYVNGTTLGF